MIQILDVSVAFKWFVEEEARETALALLDRVRDAPKDFAVPELFFNEMLAVFCRVADDPKEIQGYMGILQDLGLARLGNGREVLSEAIHFSKQYHLTGYDAVYVASAKLVGGVWITADEAAHRKIKPLRLSQLLSEI